MTYEEALKSTNDRISKGRIQPEQENYSYIYRVQEALEKQTEFLKTYIHTMFALIVIVMLN